MNPKIGKMIKVNFHAKGFAPIACKQLKHDPAGTLPIHDWQQAAHESACIPQHVKPSKKSVIKKTGIKLIPISAPYTGQREEPQLFMRLYSPSLLLKRNPCYYRSIN